MKLSMLVVLFVGSVSSVVVSGQGSQDTFIHSVRTSGQDLEIGGDVPGMQRGFIRYKDLLTLPQSRILAKNDVNFKDGTRLSGVYLDTLMQKVGLSPGKDLVSAMCADHYEAHYTIEYRHTHRPLLVLKIDDKLPHEWSPGLAPYLISHESFIPSYRVLSHVDEAQVPYGVVRLEFHAQRKALATIAPHGSFPTNAPQMFGYKIAQQNCLRCHNQGTLGGLKGHSSWSVLAQLAVKDPRYFAAYIASPLSENPAAKMPAYSKYDEKTRQALTAYFQTFMRKHGDTSPF